jgi:hypothetical protein
LPRRLGELKLVDMVGALLDNAPQQCESDLVQRAMVLTSVCDPVAYIEGIAGPSDKAHAELMVDSNAILACPIITQLLHPVAGRNSQVLQLSGRVKHLATCNRCAP